jgi:hypothetical protein
MSIKKRLERFPCKIPVSLVQGRPSKKITCCVLLPRPVFVLPQQKEPGPGCLAAGLSGSGQRGWRQLKMGHANYTGDDLTILERNCACGRIQASTVPAGHPWMGERWEGKSPSQIGYIAYNISYYLGCPNNAAFNETGIQARGGDYAASPVRV